MTHPEFLESIAPMFPRDPEKRERDEIADNLYETILGILDDEPSASGNTAGAAGYAAQMAYRLLSLGADADIRIRGGRVSMAQVAK